MNAVYCLQFSEDDERPADRNTIDFFFEKNPQMHKFSDFPKAKFAPGFVHLSESDMVDLLYSN
ncbi:hypothetical protein BGZ65_005594 [Modicella reniformis]|uniref:Uncharacterized protein n=1 Tax=Modicella reniformis TaxID=1440133 RepID=A0A9P6IX50_9FUNG|nr:hypothetical protein BGZ65_005594 [Modicella reniformis]